MTGFFMARVFGSRRVAMPHMDKTTAILSIVFAVCSAVCCDATEYSAGSFNLYQSLPNQYRTDYTCIPRPGFENTISCNPNRKAATGTANISNLLLDASSSSILYAYEKSSRPDTLDRVEK